MARYCIRNLPIPLLLVALLASPAAALVNGQAPADDDTAYDAVAAFSRTTWLIEDDTDKYSHSWFGAAVLIAPDVVLTARHLIPNNGKNVGRLGQFSVRFRRHQSGTIGSTRQPADSFHNVRIVRWVVSDRYDLALGILETPVDHITPVKVALDLDAVEQREAVLAGWGSVSNWRGLAKPRIELRVGPNSVTARGPSLRVDSYRTEPREDPQGQQKPWIIDEHAVPNMHDSGGSMFVLDDEGKPMLVGIISTYTGGTWLPAAADAGFPLEAATRGSAALIEAVEADD